MTYFDEFVDDLLTKDRVCDIILPRLTQRAVLEETEGLAPRQSLLVSETDEVVALPSSTFHSALFRYLLLRGLRAKAD